jgi:hypothetical protein
MGGCLRSNYICWLKQFFFAGFRAYESFIRDVFLLYCMEKRPQSGKKAKSYLKPRTFEHAELLIQSSMPFLDWTNPSTVISRAELYLENGYPIKGPYARYLDRFRDFKHIRNHIAHSSKESLENYKKVLRKHFGTIPLIIPSPGEFLLQLDKKDASKYLLLTFFEIIENLATDIS